MSFKVGDKVKVKVKDKSYGPKGVGVITKIRPDGAETTHADDEIPHWVHFGDIDTMFIHASQETEIILPPGTEWTPGEKPQKCTCGISAIGGGKHSSWCDIKED